MSSFGILDALIRQGYLSPNQVLWIGPANTSKFPRRRYTLHLRKQDTEPAELECIFYRIIETIPPTVSPLTCTTTDPEKVYNHVIAGFAHEGLVIRKYNPLDFIYTEENKSIGTIINDISSELMHKFDINVISRTKDGGCRVGVKKMTHDQTDLIQSFESCLCLRVIEIFEDRTIVRLY
jgi:hypothetical protein